MANLPASTHRLRAAEDPGPWERDRGWTCSYRDRLGRALDLRKLEVLGVRNLAP